jgi:hypothetical protein
LFQFSSGWVTFGPHRSADSLQSHLELLIAAFALAKLMILHDMDDTRRRLNRRLSLTPVLDSPQRRSPRSPLASGPRAGAQNPEATIMTNRTIAALEHTAALDIS